MILNSDCSRPGTVEHTRYMFLMNRAFSDSPETVRLYNRFSTFFIRYKIDLYDEVAQIKTEIKRSKMTKLSYRKETEGLIVGFDLDFEQPKLTLVREKCANHGCK